MKKILFLLLASTVILASCKSNEEKAEELIKKELSKTLYDFDSYQPIETIVNEAKANVFNDTTCWHKAEVLAFGMEKTIEYANKCTKAKEYMDIYGPPTSYSSSYSDKQYYKYKAECEEALEEAQNSHRTCKRVALELKELVSKLDTTEVIGWEVTHRFRCKTKGGSAAIGNYRYVIDKDFETVLLREDTDEDEHVREAIKTLETDYWENMDL